MTIVDVNPPRWVADPAGRYAQRYWDGTRWTEYVAGNDGGTATSDPLGPAERPAPDGPPFPDPSTRPLGLALAAGPSFSAHPQPRPDPAGAAAGWELDPTGRHAQRYWDGTRWTEYVAGHDGGPAATDPTPVDSVHAAPPPTAVPDPADPPQLSWAAAPLAGLATVPHAFAPTPDAAPDASPSHAVPDQPPRGPAAPGTAGAAQPPGGAGPSPAGASARPHRRRRTALVAALVVVALLAAGAAALDLAGVFAHGGPVNPVAHRVASKALGTAARRKASGAATTSTTAAPPATGTVLASQDPCGLLSSAQIAAVTGIPVGAGQPITNGCAWRGPGSIGGTISALDRQVLGTKEGVLLTVSPASGTHPSVTCSPSIPFLTVASGVCSGSGSAEGQYAMFAAPGNVLVDVSIHTARPETTVQLEELAQHAYQRTS